MNNGKIINSTSDPLIYSSLNVKSDITIKSLSLVAKLKKITSVRDRISPTSNMAIGQQQADIMSQASTVQGINKILAARGLEQLDKI